MFSVIGLALDLIGAFVLARGLFRHSEALFPGWRRSPVDAAEDHAFGLVGFSFLSSGFVVQALPALGATWTGSTCAVRTTALLTLLGGSLAAYVSYGAAYIALLRRELRHVKEHSPAEPPTMKWKPQWRHFWHHDWVRD